MRVVDEYIGRNSEQVEKLSHAYDYVYSALGSSGCCFVAFPFVTSTSLLKGRFEGG